MNLDIGTLVACDAAKLEDVPLSPLQQNIVIGVLSHKDDEKVWISACYPQRDSQGKKYSLVIQEKDLIHWQKSYHKIRLTPMTQNSSRITCPRSSFHSSEKFRV